jgi:hypothetical protein
VSLQHARSRSHGQCRRSDAEHESGADGLRHLPGLAGRCSGSGSGTLHGVAVVGPSTAAESVAPRTDSPASAGSAAIQVPPLGVLVSDAAGRAPTLSGLTASLTVMSSHDGACGCKGAAPATAGSSGPLTSETVPCVSVASCSRAAPDCEAVKAAGAGSAHLPPFSAGAAIAAAGAPVSAPLVGPATGAAVVITAEEAGVDEFYRLRLAQPSALKPRLRDNQGLGLPERG